MSAKIKLILQFMLALGIALIFCFSEKIWGTVQAAHYDHTLHKRKRIRLFMAVPLPRTAGNVFSWGCM